MQTNIRTTSGGPRIIHTQHTPVPLYSRHMPFLEYKTLSGYGEHNETKKLEKLKTAVNETGDNKKYKKCTNTTTTYNVHSPDSQENLYFWCTHLHVLEGAKVKSQWK